MKPRGPKAFEPVCARNKCEVSSIITVLSALIQWLFYSLTKYNFIVLLGGGKREGEGGGGGEGGVEEGGGGEGGGGGGGKIRTSDTATMYYATLPRK